MTTNVVNLLDDGATAAVAAVAAVALVVNKCGSRAGVGGVAIETAVVVAVVEENGGSGPGRQRLMPELTASLH